MKRTVTAIIVMTAIAGTAAPALAKSPFNCPPGLAKKSPACVPPGQAKKLYRSKSHDDDRYRRHEDDDDRYRRHEDDDDYRRYRRYDGTDYGDYRPGDRLPDGYKLILVPENYGLTRLDDGSDYYIADGVIYRISRETNEIVDLYRAIDAILN